LVALGLRKMNQSIEVDMENPCLAGMVEKVKHLLKVEEI
ncbi:MAG: 50S ribosomal protein L30, partial [Bacteroidales bacterium]|nr:50S ribosomal protein L30 [Bacteroidales bacterium]